MTTLVSEAKTATWQYDATHSSVEFSVKHMMISMVKGRFGKVEVKLAGFDGSDPRGAAVEVRVDVSSVDTREEKRDQHLRTSDFFDAANHPELLFKSRRVEHRGGDRYQVTGDLTIRGVTRQAPLEVEVSPVVADPWGGERFAITGKAHVSRKEFGLHWNPALEAGGFVVGDEVKIAVEAEFVRPKA